MLAELNIQKLPSLRQRKGMPTPPHPTPTARGMPSSNPSPVWVNPMAGVPGDGTARRVQSCPAGGRDSLQQQQCCCVTCHAELARVEAALHL